MDDTKIEKLLRDAAAWEPPLDAPEGLAHAALARRRKRAFLPTLTLSTAFAAGFCAIAVLRMPSATERPVAPVPAPQTPVRTADAGTRTAAVPNAAAALKPARAKKPAPAPERSRSEPARVRRTPRSIERENPLVPRYQMASDTKPRFQPIDPPRVVPGIIAEPTGESGQMQFRPAAVALDDSDVVLADFRNE